MSLSIRPATSAELRFVRSSWRQTFIPRYSDAHSVHGVTGHSWGRGRQLAHATARRMLTQYIESLATPEHVLVVSLDVDGEPEALGWICRELLTTDEGPSSVVVHAVYVRKGARRQGLGTQLLRYVRAEAAHVVDGETLPLVPAVMTADGARVWK